MKERGVIAIGEEITSTKEIGVEGRNPHGEIAALPQRIHMTIQHRNERERE